MIRVYYVSIKNLSIDVLNVVLGVVFVYIKREKIVVENVGIHIVNMVNNIIDVKYVMKISG